MALDKDTPNAAIPSQPINLDDSSTYPPCFSPPPLPPPDIPTGASPDVVVDPGAALTPSSVVWMDPLHGIPPGPHTDVEQPLRTYLQDVPRPDEMGAWETADVELWLDTGTVSGHNLFVLCSLNLTHLTYLQNTLIRKLKSIDPELAETYNARINLIQEFVEAAFHTYQEVVQKRERDAVEAARKEAERQRLLAEDDARRKQEEEEVRLAEAEAARKEKAAILDKVKELAAKDPDALAEAGLRVVSPHSVTLNFPLTYRQQSTTYPAVTSGKCDYCMTRGIVCVGMAGKACKECTRLHYACSNNSGKSQHFIYPRSIQYNSHF